MKYINFDFAIDESFDINSYEQIALRAFTDLHIKRTGKMSGWLDCEKLLKDTEKKQMLKIVKEVKKEAEVLVVIGIGGSYLGAKAAIDFLSDYYKFEDGLEVIFVGNSLSEKYLIDTAKYLENKNFYINVISKSGGTLEPAIAFRYFKDIIEKKYKSDAKKHIIITTSKNSGSLRKISIKEGYRTLFIPDNIGGRYSVLTPVGLFPIACAGFDIDKILEGARETKEEVDNVSFRKNPAMQYAVIRNVLYKQGKDIEVYSTFNPNMRQFLEWLKQLFGESECKNFAGIFPASLILSTDLHSMGQLMQQGKRNIFETFINANRENIKNNLYLEKDKNDLDNLNFVTHKNINEINKIARLATMKAHRDGKVPIIDISFEKQDEKTLGAMFYFFEYSCAISAYILGVNPFNQPGVEAYKKNIKEILNKK